MEVLILTPCHKCKACLKHRAALWTARAIQETKAAARTWFCTLTLAPDHAHLALTRARVAEGSQGVDFDRLGQPEQFKLWVAQVSPEITKFLKRVRDRASYAPLRYLFVAEGHKSGVPHFHALIHEPNPAMPVRHRMLSESWKLGFSNFRLVRPDYTLEEDGRIIRPAHYVASYLGKDLRARVRASQYYGKATSVGLPFEEGEGGYVDREKTRMIF